MGKKLVLIGGGGHCQSVLDTALRTGTFDDIVITDSQIPAGTRILGCEVAGDDECLEDLRRQGHEHAFITVGSVGVSPLREKIAGKLGTMGFKFPSIIDPSAVISDSAFIGAGTFVGKNVVINAKAYIGKHCIINTGVIIEHECRVEDFAHVSVGSILCGEVKVGKNSFIGAGSTVIQCVNIGDRVTIGANSTILSSVEDDMKCYGILKKG